MVPVRLPLYQTPAVVDWRAVWYAHVAPHLPQEARVSVKGLSNALQCEAREYLTSFKNHLTYGRSTLYARPLRAVDGLSTAGGRVDRRSTPCR